MQRRYTAPAAPPPPPSSALTRYDESGRPVRPRQLSAVRMRALSLPKGALHHRPFSPASTPWDRSLRSAQPVYIPGPGFGPSRRTSSRRAAEQLPDIRPRATSAAAAVFVTTTAAPPPPATRPAPPSRRRTSGRWSHPPLEVKSLSLQDNGLSTSFTLPTPPSEPCRRPSSHRQRALRSLLGADERDEVTALTAYTSPNAVIFAAYDTLRLLFLPLWWRYRYHRQLQRATQTVAKFVLAKVHARRLRRKERAADLILRVLRSSRTQLLSAVNQLEVRVVRIQRAFRQHRRSVHAVVELNLRRIRRDVEKPYWATVVAQREAELAVQQQHQQQTPVSAVAKAVQEVIAARRESVTRFSAVRRQTFASSTDPRAPAAAVAAAPTSYELDVYNYYMIGRLPESLLRSEIASAVFASTRRSAKRACLMDEMCTPKHKGREASNYLARQQIKGSVGRGSKTKVVNKMHCPSHLPRFLPESVCTSIMNNTCYVTSLMRNDAMLRAHLKPRASHLEAY